MTDPRPVRPLALVLWTVVLPCAVVLWAFSGAASAPLHDWAEAPFLAAGDRWRAPLAAALGWAWDASVGGMRQPLAWLSFCAQSATGGGTIADLRWGQILLHAVGAGSLGLLTWLLLFVTGAARLWRVGAPVLAALVGVAWGVHPLRVETVQTLSARGEVLAVPLLATCAGAWVLGIVSPRVRAGWIGVAVLTAALAGLAWPGAVGAVAGLWALARWLRRVRPESSAAEGVGGPLALVAAPLVLAFLASWSVAPPLAEMSAGARVAGFGHALLAPLWSTLWPADLHPAHGAEGGFPAQVPSAWWVQTALVGLVAWSAVAGSLRGRGRSLALLSTLALAAAAVVLTPGGLGGDRTAHVATAALFVGLGLALGEGAGCWMAFLGVPLLAALVLAPLVVTRDRLRDWATTEALEDRVLAVDGANDVVLGARGDAARRRGAAAEARAWYERALYDRSIEAGGGRAHAETGLAALAFDEGDLDAAASHAERAASLAPWLAEPRLLLGNTRIQQGRADDAVHALDAATRLAPESPECWFAFGRALVAAGDRRRAAAAFRRVTELTPDDERAQEELRRVE